MTSATFDTHKFVRRLKEAGLPETQAEAIADAFRDAQSEAELATKYDIAELQTSLPRINSFDSDTSREVFARQWH